MKTPAPPIISSAKLIAYAFNDDLVTYTDKFVLFAGAEGDLQPVGEVPCLAICETYIGDGRYQLLLCDEEWDPQFTFAFTTIDEAKRKAERGYEGITGNWISSQYTEEEIDAYLRNEYDVDPKSEWWKVTCSFCNKTNYEVERVVQSTRATICDICVRDFYQMFQEQGDA